MKRRFVARIYGYVLRTVKIKVGEFKATTFDELFEKTKALNWGDYIPENGEFPVIGKSLKSELFSVSDCQRIVKKAVVEKLKQHINVQLGLKKMARYSVLRLRC